MANKNRKYAKKHTQKKEEGGRKYQNMERKECKMDDFRGNDISWWNKSPLYPLATSVQYNKIPGYVYDHSRFIPGSTNDLAVEFGDVQTDGCVVTVFYDPTIGYADNASDPINQCFNSLFARLVHHTNSANVGFQQADVALLTLSILTTANLIADAKRALGCTNAYARENGFLPRAILHACGYTFEDLQQNKPLYVARLETLIRNFNALGIPNYIDLFKRGIQLGRNVYLDEDNLMSFPYVFVANGYYVYSDTEFKLQYKPRTFPLPETERSTMDLTLGYIEEALEALRNTSDLGNIMGAIRRAFPEADILALDGIGYDELTTVTYDRNVAWQFNNLFVVDGQVNFDSISVTQDPVQNCLICKPVYECNAALAPIGKETPLDIIINSYDGAVGDEFVMESTRMIPICKYTSDRNNLTIVDCGTEIPTSISITSLYWDDELETYSPVMRSLKSTVDFAELQPAGFEGFGSYLKLTQLKNHPRIMMYNSTTGKYFGTLGDLFVYTSISQDQLKQLNLAAKQSIYQLTI